MQGIVGNGRLGKDTVNDGIRQDTRSKLKFRSCYVISMRNPG